jgi:hypothetical protein
MRTGERRTDAQPHHKLVLVCGAKCPYLWDNSGKALRAAPLSPFGLMRPAFERSALSCGLGCPTLPTYPHPFFFSVSQEKHSARRHYPEHADMRPSIPALKRKPRLNQRCFSWRPFRFSEGLPFLGKTTRFTPACQAVFSFSPE